MPEDQFYFIRLSLTVWTGFAAKYFLRPRSGLNDNSPALQRWGEARRPFFESVKRTTEQTCELATFELSRPLHGLRPCLYPKPTDESVGYYHSSASPTVQQKLSASRGVKIVAGEPGKH